MLSTFPMSPAFSLPLLYCLTMPRVLPDLGRRHSVVTDGLPIFYYCSPSGLRMGPLVPYLHCTLWVCVCCLCVCGVFFCFFVFFSVLLCLFLGVPSSALNSFPSLWLSTFVLGFLPSGDGLYFFDRDLHQAITGRCWIWRLILELFGSGTGWWQGGGAAWWSSSSCTSRVGWCFFIHPLVMYTGAHLGEGPSFVSLFLYIFFLVFLSFLFYPFASVLVLFVFFYFFCWSPVASFPSCLAFGFGFAFSFSLSLLGFPLCVRPWFCCFLFGFCVSWGS